MTDEELIAYLRLQGLDKDIAAIAALPARGVGVKPLVWQPIVKGARRPERSRP